MMPSTTARVLSAGYMANALMKVDPIKLTELAYTSYYNPEQPPHKICVYRDANTNVLLMPYYDHQQKTTFEKIVMANASFRPGVTAKAWLTRLDQHEQAVMADATDMTGFRTAAKSLYVSEKILPEHSLRSQTMKIDIYGSSTQALYHAILLKRKYASSKVSLVARSESAIQKARCWLDQRIGPNDIAIDRYGSRKGADIIVTATSTRDALITEEVAESARLILAVGSSSGDVSELEYNVALRSNLLIDSRISAAGKGEANMLLLGGARQLSDIVELIDLMKYGLDVLQGLNRTVFISKGLVIEDYACLRTILNA